MKKLNKVALFCAFFIFAINCIFGNKLPYPILNVSFDNEVPLYLPDDEPKMTEIIKGIWEAYKKMWEDFKNNGKGSLPYCLYDAFNALRQKESIEFRFSIGGQKTMPVTGDIWEGRPALYAGLPDSRLEGKGIWIFGIWKSEYRTSMNNSKKYCLKAVIFHEMLHYAIDDAVKNKTPIKDEFSVNIGQAPGTNIANLFADEGLIEDCELRLFPCGSDGYKSNEKNQFYKNGARRFNPDQEDCELCKVCKIKKVF